MLSATPMVLDVSTSAATLPRYASICAALQERVRSAPDATAYRFLRDGEEEYLQLNYRQLGARVAALATHLRKFERPQARVLILHPAGPDFVVGFLACAFAGMIAVPAYPPRRNRKAARLELMIADAQAEFVMAPAAYHDQIREVSAADMTFISVDTELEDSAVQACHLETLALPDPGATLYLQYTSGSTSAPKGVIISHDNLVWTLEDMDRGWGHTADSLICSWLPVFHDMGLIYGVLASIYVGVPCVLMHHADFLQRPLRWLQVMHKYRATHCCAPNFAYALCTARVTAAEAAQLDLSNWKVAVNGSEPVDVETLRAFSRHFVASGFRASSFAPGYGLAEATLKVTAVSHDQPPTVLYRDTAALEQNKLKTVAEFDPLSRALVGCGRSNIATDIAIVCPQSHKQLHADMVGEIWVRGPIVAQGYWNNADADAAQFGASIFIVDPLNRKKLDADVVGEIWVQGAIDARGYWNDPAADSVQFGASILESSIDATASSSRGGWMRTGDLGFMHNGELFVTGRLKDMLIIRGRNLYPQDIERCAARAHAAIKGTACAAFGIQHNRVEVLCLALEIERSALRSTDFDEVRAAVAAAVTAEFDILPHTILLLRPNALPKTSSGKLQRAATRRAFLQNALSLADEQVNAGARSTGYVAVNGASANGSSLDEPSTNGLGAKASSARQKPQSSVPAADAPPTQQTDPTEWILNWICRELSLNHTPDLAQRSWEQLGLDSLSTQRLLGDVKQHFSVRMSSEAAWDYATPTALAEYISGQNSGRQLAQYQSKNGQAAAQSAARAGVSSQTQNQKTTVPDPASLTPADIDALSDEQVDALLVKLLSQ